MTQWSIGAPDAPFLKTRRFQLAGSARIPKPVCSRLYSNDLLFITILFGVSNTLSINYLVDNFVDKKIAVFMCGNRGMLCIFAHRDSR